MAESFIVIGGGLVGAACAYRLQTAGFDVTLIDQGPPERAASFGNAGHIAVEQVEPLASWATIRTAPGMLFRFGGPLEFRLRDVGAWGPWALEFVAASGRRSFEAGTEALGGLMDRAAGAWTGLLDEIGCSDLIRTDGHAVLWMSEAEATEGRARWAAANTGPARTSPLDGETLAAYRALLLGRPPVAGLRFEGTARLVSPEAVRRALIAALKAGGGTVMDGDAVSLDHQGSVRLANGQGLSADRVLVAAGVRSRALMEGLGARTPLVAERGYSIQIPAPAWPSELPTAVIEGQAMVLAPHVEGLRITSYVEFARPNSPPDTRKWERLERRVREAGLEVPAGAQRWIGCRPTLPDYLPAIGAMEGGRVLYAFGHQHLGVTLAAVTAELVAGLARGQPPDPRFDLARFGR